MPVSLRPAQVLDATLSAAGTTTDYTASRPYTLYDGVIAATATQVGGTVKVQRQALGAGGFNDVTDAVAVDTANAVTRVGTLVAAQVAFAATDVMRLLVVGAATNGRIRLKAMYDQIPGAS